MRQGLCTIAVDVLPDDVDAGGSITLRARVAGYPEDGKPPVVVIRDQAGVELARAKLTKGSPSGADDAAHHSCAIALEVPRTAGDQLWRAVAVSVDRHGATREVAATEVRFLVRQHALDLVVWDVPSAIEAGKPFRFMAGLRCSSACAMRGQNVRVTDGQGQQVAATSFAAEPWPGTQALYAADVEAIAPETAGDHEWHIAASAGDLALPHAAGKTPMRLTVVPPADCHVTIEVIDAEKRLPVAGARVVMHPYRATANASGVASLRVTKGQYDILVAGSKFAPVRITVDVSADFASQAVLDPEPPLEPDDEA